MTFFEKKTFSMVLGHPTMLWHKCGPSPCGLLPMGMAMGLFFPFGLIFLPLNGYFGSNIQDFFCKNGPKGQKATPEVADGNHGDLGRGQEGKNGLEGGQTSENADPLLWVI